jgi:hypothetical protein
MRPFHRQIFFPISSTDFFSHFIDNSVDEQFSDIDGKLFLEKNIKEINVTLFNNFRINVVMIKKDINAFYWYLLFNSNIDSSSPNLYQVIDELKRDYTFNMATNKRITISGGASRRSRPPGT